MAKHPEPDLKKINEKALYGEWGRPMYPIKYAYLEDDPAMLQKFIDAGADVNIDLGRGWTLLHELCATAIDAMIQDRCDDFYPHHVEMIKILLANGADLHKKNISGEKPLDVINAYRHETIEQFDNMVSLFIPAIPNVADLISYENNSWHKIKNQPPHNGEGW